MSFYNFNSKGNTEALLKFYNFFPMMTRFATESVLICVESENVKL